MLILDTEWDVREFEDDNDQGYILVYYQREKKYTAVFGTIHALIDFIALHIAFIEAERTHE